MKEKFHWAGEGGGGVCRGSESEKAACCALPAAGTALVDEADRDLCPCQRLGEKLNELGLFVP